jgi:hypothetical protein
VVATAPLAIPAPPGYGRAYASTTVLMRSRGTLLPAHAQWRPLVPGTDNQYTGPLFNGPDSEVPLSFPQWTDERGTIRVWAPEPVRLELVAWAGSYPPVKQVIDLLFTEDTEGVVSLQSHISAQNAHPTSSDPGNVLEWRANGLYVPQGAVPPEYLTQDEGDARYTQLGDTAALEDRVTTLEGQVAALLSAQSAQNDLIAALQDQMARHLHEAGDWDYLAGAMTMPEDIP